jgi:hypothetical protein
VWQRFADCPFPQSREGEKHASRVVINDLGLVEHHMFLKQLVSVAFRALHAAARHLLEAYTRQHGLLPTCERKRAARKSLARFSRRMESFEVMAARAASGA